MGETENKTENALECCRSRMRLLRKEKGLSQSDVASVLGLSQQLYSLVERGKYRMYLLYIIELARYYGVSVEWLSGVGDEKTRFLSEVL